MAPRDSKPDDLIAVGEAARLVGVSVDTIRRWEEQGRISASRTQGRQRRFRRSEVESLLLDQSKTAS